MKNPFASKQAIELTKKQFLSLLKAVYLGNWMATANRTPSEEKPMHKAYNDIADYIYSLAPKFGLADKIEHELEYDVSGKLTEVSRLHEEYDEDIFWDELCDRLGERDFHRKYSPEEIRKMISDDRFLKLQECIIAWEVEAEENGIERLEIVTKSPYYGK